MGIYVCVFACVCESGACVVSGSEAYVVYVEEMHVRGFGVGESKAERILG